MTKKDYVKFAEALNARYLPCTSRLGQSVKIVSMARTDAVGRITRVTPSGYEVRLPNWQADGVHLDTFCWPEELETGHGRAAARPRVAASSATEGGAKP